MGKSFEEILPELQVKPFLDFFAKVWREDIIILGIKTAAKLILNGVLQTFYFDFQYKAIKNKYGKVICNLYSAVDVTERHLNRELVAWALEKVKLHKLEQTLKQTTCNF